MRIKIAAVIAAISLMVVGGCSDPHKNMHCVQSHDETVPIHGYHVISTGKTTVIIPYIIHYAHENVCDKWVPNSK